MRLSFLGSVVDQQKDISLFFRRDEFRLCAAGKFLSRLKIKTRLIC